MRKILLVLCTFFLVGCKKESTRHEEDDNVPRIREIIIDKDEVYILDDIDFSFEFENEMKYQINNIKVGSDIKDINPSQQVNKNGRSTIIIKDFFITNEIGLNEVTVDYFTYLNGQKLKIVELNSTFDVTIVD